MNRKKQVINMILKWIGINRALPQPKTDVLCLYPNGSMRVQHYSGLYGTHSLDHDLYGRCIFWACLPSDEQIIKLLAANRAEEHAAAKRATELEKVKQEVEELWQDV